MTIKADIRRYVLKLLTEEKYDAEKVVKALFDHIDKYMKHEYHKIIEAVNKAVVQKSIQGRIKKDTE